MSGYEVNAPDKLCPGCQGLIPTQAVLCTRCGLNLKTGGRVREAEHKAADPQLKARQLRKARATGDVESVGRPGRARPTGLVCQNCGYDTTGLAGKPCPECGHDRSVRSDREIHRRKEIQNYWRTTFMVAAIGGAVGTAINLLAGVLGLGFTPLFCFVHEAACVAALFVGYFVMCFFFLGFEEDVRGLALRLLGVSAVWAGLWISVGLVTVGGFYAPMFTGVVTAIALAAPLHYLTDRDWDDSLWIAIAAWTLKYVGTYVVTVLM